MHLNGNFFEKLIFLILLKPKKLFSLDMFKAAYSVTMNIFRKIYFLFKSFVKAELSYVFTINLFTRAENCTEK